MNVPNIEIEASPSMKKLLSYVVAILIGFFIAFCIRAFLVETFVIPTGSMEPTIMVNEKVLGYKTPYLGKNCSSTMPERGDIITFKGRYEDKIFIKRVIGLPGDSINFKSGKVTINGEPYTDYGVGISEPIDPSIQFPYIVPDESVFVLGDNRENSADSRVMGAIPIYEITSKVFAKIAIPPVKL